MKDDSEKTPVHYRMDKPFFLVNPAAAGGTARAKWEDALKTLKESGLVFDWEYTAESNSAASQVRKKLDSGCNLIVAVGGDGTLQGALNGFINDGKPYSDSAVLTFWPLGSGCDFARTIYGEKKPGDLIGLLTEGYAKIIDFGECAYADASFIKRQRYFINSFDVGVGADTCYRVNKSKKRLGGAASFFLAALASIISFRWSQIRLTIDGVNHDDAYMMIVAGNGRFFGGGMMVNPEAKIDDGWLDIMTVRKASKRKILMVLPKIYSGTHIGAPMLGFYRGKTIAIKTERPMIIECDGECAGYTDVTIKLKSGSLPFLMPRKRKQTLLDN